MGDYSGIAGGLMDAFSGQAGPPRKQLGRSGEPPSGKDSFWEWLRSQGYQNDQINEIRMNPSMMAYLYDMYKQATGGSQNGDYQGGNQQTPFDKEQAQDQQNEYRRQKQLREQLMAGGKNPNDYDEYGRPLEGTRAWQLRQNAPGSGQSSNASMGMGGETDGDLFDRANARRAKWAPKAGQNINLGLFNGGMLPDGGWKADRNR